MPVQRLRTPVESVLSDRSLPPRLAHAFAPIHKSAFGIAVGFTAALVIAFATLVHLAIVGPDGALGLLSHYFYGFDISIRGAIVGALWGFLTGYIAGWFLAFVRNVILAVWLLVVRTKAEFSQPFLDHL